MKQNIAEDRIIMEENSTRQMRILNSQNLLSQTI